MKKNNKGFVLLETIVVTGVLGIILTTMYPAFLNLTTVIENENKYDSVEYIYRTKGYNNLINDNLPSSDSIKIICQGNCTNNFYEAQAVYLVNPNKINEVLNKDIYITTKKYLTYVKNNYKYSDTILVIAFKNADATDQNYEYASIRFKTPEERQAEIEDSLIDSFEQANFESIPGLNNTLVAKIYSEVKDLNPDDYVHTASYRSRYFDNTADCNLRFESNNYIKFNNEMWRIIGVMNNVDDGTGKKETRIKIMRDEPIGEYAWDSSTSNAGQGIKDWTQADLMQELNGDYLYQKSGTTKWYDAENNHATEGNYNYSLGLSTEAKSFIKNAVWHTGEIIVTQRESRDSESLHPLPFKLTTISPREAYNSEKNKTWKGLVGLVNASDFGYSLHYLTTSKNWTSCNIGFGQVLNSNCDSPFSNSWIIKKTSFSYVNSGLNMDTYYKYMWTINAAYDMNAVIALTNNFAAADYPSHNNYSKNVLGSTREKHHFNYMVHPVVYLKPGVFYNGGDGTEANPYKIS